MPERRQKQAQAAAAQSPSARTPSAVWTEHREELQSQVTPKDYSTYVVAIRGIEADGTLWLEVPNQFAAEWVAANMPLIEGVLRPYTPLTIRVCIG